MNWKEYLSLSEKTMSLEFHANEKVQRVLHGVMGICTEVGELYQGLTTEKADVINLKEEIGDYYWYIAILHREFEEFEQPSDILIPDKGIPSEYILQDLTISSSILLDLMKKKLYYNKTLDAFEFVNLVRHIEYYLIALAFNYDLTKDDILERNIHKLKARYGDKFSSDKAINRDLDTERDVLEQ